jgi:hypothetical protein
VELERERRERGERKRHIDMGRNSHNEKIEREIWET